jgi:hypothetical protein
MLTSHQRTMAAKAAAEKSPDEMPYETELDWKQMKKLKSETKARAWHVKVAGQNYQVCQVDTPRMGETLFGYKATGSGRIAEWKPLFEKKGTNHLMGIEYLLRVIEGQDISKLDLNTDSRYTA